MEFSAKGCRSVLLAVAVVVAGCGKPAPESDTRTGTDSAPQAYPPARIILLTGAVYHRTSAEQDQWVRVKVGQELASGGMLWTRDNGRALLRFPEGPRVLLQSKTTIVLRVHERAASDIRVKIGRLNVWVRRKTARKFLAGTGTAVAAVRGTRFSIEADESGNTTFDLFEGHLEITGRRNSRRTLKSGQRLVVGAGKSVAESVPVEIPDRVTLPKVPPKMELELVPLPGFPNSYPDRIKIFRRKQSLPPTKTEGGMPGFPNKD